MLWGLGIGDWGLAQSPIPNPQSPSNTKIVDLFKLNNSHNNNIKINPFTLIYKSTL